jgi:predicted metal-dependent enzyme (double-stranded beta helix superfamily)
MIAAIENPLNAAPFEKLSAVARGLGQAYLSAARETLRATLENPGLLDSVTLERSPDGYTRNLLFGDNEMSVWALVWAPGSATCIHDHHCSCCFGVVSGAITETWFRPVDAERVVVATEQVRSAGFIAAMLPNGPNIHQMRNDSPHEAISVHIYGFDHRRVGTSIQRQYALATE